MMKKYLMSSMAFLAFGLTLAGCSSDDGLTEADITNNAQKVLGITIDPNHDWNMVTSTEVSISVNLDYGAEYTVYIFADEPLTSNANYIGSATLVSGESTTINVARPIGAAVLYAACYDKDSHAIYKSFPVRTSGTEVAFGDTTRGVKRATTTGNRWSVTPQNMPDLSAYTTGTTVITASNNNTDPANPVVRYEIPEGTTWTANIPKIQAASGVSVYVNGTWNLTTEQRTNGNCVIVVGPKGVINVPSGVLLSTNANNEQGTTGMIYVQPGGVIQGDGELQFSNGTQTFSYNGGTIAVKNININGGTLYNAGEIGSANGVKPDLVGPGGTDEVPSKLINLGHGYFNSIGGAGMAIDNACNLYVTGNLTLGKTSKMDDRSYIECGSLTLGGSNNGNIILYMGNAAYMNCKGDFSVNNFGVWGPTTNSARAIFKINRCTGCVYTTGGNASYYMVDNVELIIPDPFFDEGVKNFYTGGVAGQLNTGHADYFNALLFYGWFNGQGCQGINSDNYEWVYIAEQGHSIDHAPWWEVDVPGYQGFALKSNASFYDVDESRATCIYGTSPSYSVTVDNTENCGVNIDKGSNQTPSPEVTTYAFEDTFMGDYDMNDVVLQVWEENERVYIKLCCTGASYDLKVFLTNNNVDYPLFGGREVHSVLGGTAGKFINTGEGDKFQTCNAVTTDIAKPSGFNAATADFWIQSPAGDIHVGTRGNTKQIGSAPYGLRIPGAWAWPKEWTPVNEAYANFSGYAADMTSNADWYKTATAGTTY